MGFKALELSFQGLGNFPCGSKYPNIRMLDNRNQSGYSI